MKDLAFIQDVSRTLALLQINIPMLIAIKNVPPEIWMIIDISPRINNEGANTDNKTLITFQLSYCKIQKDHGNRKRQRNITQG